MFNMLIDVPSRTSTAVRSLKVDALKSQAYVEFNSGYTYAYGNVSKRAILHVLFNPDIRKQSYLGQKKYLLKYLTLSNKELYSFGCSS